MSEDDIVSECVLPYRRLHLARVLCTTRSVSLVSRRASARPCGAEYTFRRCGYGEICRFFFVKRARGDIRNRGAPGAPVFTRRLLTRFRTVPRTHARTLRASPHPPGARPPLSVCRAPAPHDVLAPRLTLVEPHTHIMHTHFPWLCTCGELPGTAQTQPPCGRPSACAMPSAERRQVLERPGRLHVVLLLSMSRAFSRKMHPNAA